MADREPSPGLIAAKSDLSYLKQVLGIHSDRTAHWNSPCPCCQGQTCMQWGPDKKYHGQWYWHCNKCGAGGDIVEALTKAGGMSYADAFRKIRDEYGGREPKKKPPSNGSSNGNGHHAPEQEIYSQPKPEPVLDMAMAEAAIQKHHEYLLKHLDMVKKWRRGLSHEVIVRYRVGFVEMADLPSTSGKKMFVPGAWLLPITDAENKLKGVRVHFEEKPHWNVGECPKTLWAPFGTDPPYGKRKLDDGTEVDSKPVHSYYGLWPHPDTLQQKRKADFSMDAAWYIQRVPERGELRDKFDTSYEANKLFLASSLSVNTDALTAPQLWDCKLQAFEEHKASLMDAVLKTADKISSKVDWSSYLFITPGELKALSALSAGLMATAPTGGENWLPRPETFNKLSGQKICMFYDADPPKRIWIDKEDHSKGVRKIFNPGLDWATKWCACLTKHGAAHVILKQGGQRTKEE